MPRFGRTSLLAGLGLLAACSGSNTPEDRAATGAAPVAIAASENAAPVSPPASPAGPGAGTTASPAATALAIPAALHGRWALVAADCTSTRGDTKGLMVVGPTSVRFYESIATLGAVKEQSATLIAARFAFSGEGMEWQRDMTLDGQEGGGVLIKREYGDDAPPGPFKYTRCK